MAGTERSAFLRGFGKQLKLFRERAGLTRAELGALVGYSVDQVASVECGRRIPKPELVDKADEVLDAGGVLAAIGVGAGAVSGVLPRRGAVGGRSG